MADVSRFDTPGSLRDLPEGAPFYAAWHKTIADLISKTTAGSGGGEFFDPSESDFDRIATRTLVWMGFPRSRLVSEHRDDRRAAFTKADFKDPADPVSGRDAQNEYLEWHVTRRGKKITRVVFSTEVPEYYREMAASDASGRDQVVALYRDFVSSSVRESDLFTGGTYLPETQWNTTKGIVHFVQDINTLTAAINLAEGSVSTPGVLDNYDQQISVPMSADARVNLDIGALSRKGLSITLAEPIGLYMIHWDDTGWTKPDGAPVGDYWDVTRGSPDAALRLVYEVPKEEGFVVGDISIGGRPIEFGGQIAEHVTVGIVGAAGRRHK
jgi:hypothetical protein